MKYRVPRFARQIGWATLPVVALIVASASMAGQTGRLAAVGKIRMLRCQASTVPAFREQFNIVGSRGATSDVAWPSEKQLAGSLQVLVGGQVITPFFATWSGPLEHPTAGRTTLILIDISGSMNTAIATGETRFEAAKDALFEFVKGFQDGTDRVAIVPFESHQVRERISDTAFTSSSEVARQQIDALPSPNGRYNTALYSAIDLGVDKLRSKRADTRNSSDYQLFVITDGENDVGHPGDDPNLLTGEDGLDAVVEKVRAHSHIQVIAVGFGDAREVDQNALGRISNKFRMVTDAEGLKQVFTPPSAPPVSHQIRVTFASPWHDRAALAARTVAFHVSLLLSGHARLESGEVTWSAPAIGLPSFDGACDADEESALLNSSRAEADVGWLSILDPVLVFLGFGVALIALWFWMPRKLWPEKFWSGFKSSRDARWAPTSADSMSSPSPARRQAPPGFPGTQTGRTPERTPVDETTVLPVSLMGTRTRLELKEAADKKR